MTLVLADGTIAKSGGKVVKNVAGYDLPKLLCGSFGTLALISEVTFRLHSIARHTTTISVFAKDAEPLGSLLLRLLNSHFSTQSIQMRCDGEGFALDVRLAALPEVLTAQCEELMKISGGMGLASEVSDDGVWTAREALFASVALVFKGTMLASGIASAASRIRELGGSAVGQAVGIVTANLPVDTPTAKLKALRGSVEAEGGSLIVLQSSPDVGFDRWGTMPDSLALMLAVKQEFDPSGVLNPGRFLGRI
jgi:glycolate oxidase FAD binding subunit